jgi:phage terminase small subunit
VVCRNATQAYRQLSEKAKVNTCRAAGSTWLNDPVIRGEIDRRIAELHERYDVTAEKITAEMAAIAFSNIKEVFGENGEALTPDKLPPEVTKSIQKVTETQFGRSITMFDKVGALKLLGQDKGLFVEKHEFSIADDLAQRLEEGRERAAAAILARKQAGG